MEMTKLKFVKLAMLMNKKDIFELDSAVISLCMFGISNGCDKNGIVVQLAVASIYYINQ